MKSTACADTPGTCSKKSTAVQFNLKPAATVAAKIGATNQTAQDELKKLKVDIHDKEVSLKATHAQIAKYEKQMETAADKKQFDAFKHEIGTARQKAQSLEDEILEGMSDVEERTAKLPDHEKAAAKAKEPTWPRSNASRSSAWPGWRSNSRRLLPSLRPSNPAYPISSAVQYQRMVNGVRGGLRWPPSRTIVAPTATRTSQFSRCTRSRRVTSCSAGRAAAGFTLHSDSRRRERRLERGTMARSANARRRG